MKNAGLVQATKEKCAETHVEFNESEVLQCGVSQAFCQASLVQTPQAKMLRVREQAFPIFADQNTDGFECTAQCLILLFIFNTCAFLT